MFLQITLPYGILRSKEKEVFSDLVDFYLRQRVSGCRQPQHVALA